MHKGGTFKRVPETFLLQDWLHDAQGMMHKDVPRSSQRRDSRSVSKLCIFMMKFFEGPLQDLLFFISIFDNHIQ